MQVGPVNLQVKQESQYSITVRSVEFQVNSYSLDIRPPGGSN